MNASFLRKHLTSLVLMAAAIGLGGYVWFIDRDQPTTREAQTRKDSLLPTFRKDNITKLSVEAHGNRAVFEKRKRDDEQDVFCFVEEKREDCEGVDQASVEKLIETFDSATRLRSLEKDVDLDAAGLNPPQVKWTLQAGIDHGISVGGEAKTPAGAHYAMVEGQGVVVIPSSVAAILTRPIDAYRNRQLIAFSTPRLTSLDVKTSHSNIRIVRFPSGEFRVDSMPGKPRVSQSAFNRLQNALGDAAAEKFLPISEARAEIASATDTLTLVLESETKGKSEFRLGGACPDEAKQGAPKLIVAIRKSPSPLAACIPSSVSTDMQVAISAMADRFVFPSRSDEVEEVSVIRGDQALELARKGGDWHARKPEDREVPAEDVQGYLDALLALEGTILDTPELGKLGLEPPQGTITLYRLSPDKPEAVPMVVSMGREIKSEQGPALTLRRNDDGIVLLVPSSASRLLEPTLTMMRSTSLLRINSQKMQRVETVFSDGTRLVLSRKNVGFSLEEPKGFPVDSSLAADIFDAVSNLRAVRWVGDRDDQSFGLQSPAMTLQLLYDGEKGEENQRFTIGSSTLDGRYGIGGKDPGVFVLPHSLESTLRNLPIDRAVFMVDSSTLRSLTLHVGRKSLRIGVKGDDWHVVEGSSLALTETALSQLRQALSELRAEGVVHVGPALDREGVMNPLLRIEIDYLPEMGRPKAVLDIGLGDVWRSMNVHYARKQGLDATFGIAQSKIRRVLDLLGEP